jgi:anaerobic ribonucleoside-triphosphate reductase
MVKTDASICPCCGDHQFANPDFFETCPVCGWQDDLVQRNEPDYVGGANKKSLNQFKSEYEAKKGAA